MMSDVESGRPARRGGQSAPDRGRALEKYRRLASSYDRFVTWSSRAMRRRAVELLGLKRGDAVLDVACGTGLSFEQIERAIGEEGTLIGIDLSGEMLDRARERAASAGWRNVTLIEASVEEADIQMGADPALFVLTHDVMRSSAALRHVLAQVRPGGRVVAAGAKLGPRWALPTNLLVRAISRRYVTTLEGLDRPWDRLEGLVPDLRVESLMLGGTYVAWGNLPADPPLPYSPSPPASAS